MASNTIFAFDFTRADRLAGAAALRRAIYPRGVRATSAAIVYGPGVVIIGVAVVGLYFHWWPQYEAARIVIAIGLAILWARFARPALGAWSRSVSNAPHDSVRSVTYAFNDEGFTFRSAFFEGLQRWPGVERIIEADGFLLLVTGANAHILPARAFLAPDQRKTFAAWALEQLRPEARARSKISA